MKSLAIARMTPPAPASSRRAKNSGPLRRSRRRYEPASSAPSTTAAQTTRVTNRLKPSMPTAPATVLKGPRGVLGRSIHSSLSQPCTRAQRGMAERPAATATTTV